MITRAHKPRLHRSTGLAQKERWWRATVGATLLCAVWLTRDFGWNVVWGSASFLLKGLAVSWMLALVSAVVGLLVAIPLAAARTYGPPAVRYLATAVVELVRATPEIMIIFWAFFALPLITGHVVPNWVAAVVALTVIATVYLAEVVRGGLCSVSQQQWDGAVCTGLSRFQAFLYVILPQAARNTLPAFLAHIVMLFKATSLVYVIGVIEFFRAVTIVNNAVVAPYALYSLLAVVYFVCSWILTSIVRRLDPKYLLVD
jgi:polar amino acid transport system permease protein